MRWPWWIAFLLTAALTIIGGYRLLCASRARAGWPAADAAVGRAAETHGHRPEMPLRELVDAGSGAVP